MLILLLAAVLQAWITNIVVSPHGNVYAINANKLIVLHPNGTYTVLKYPRTLTAICLQDNKPILGTWGGLWMDHKFLEVGEGWVTACSDNAFALSTCCPPHSKVGSLTLNDTVVGIFDNYLLTWGGKILLRDGTLVKELGGYITSYSACKDLIAIATCCPDKVYVLKLPSFKTVLELNTLATGVKFMYCKYLALASRVNGVSVYSLNGTRLWHLNFETFSVGTWADKVFAGLNTIKSFTVDVPPIRCRAVGTYVNVIVETLGMKELNPQTSLLVDEFKRWLTSFSEKLERFRELVYSKPTFTYMLDVNYASLTLKDMLKGLNECMKILQKTCIPYYNAILPYYMNLRDSASSCISYLTSYAQERWQKVSKTLKLERPLVKYLLSSNETCVGNEVVIGLIVENVPSNPPLNCSIGGEVFSIPPGLTVTKTLIIKVSREGVNLIKVPITCSFLDKRVEEVITIKVIGKRCR